MSPRPTDKLSPLFSWTAAVASKESRLSPTQRHVLLTLALYMSSKGDSAFPHVSTTLADDTGLGASTVRECLAKAAKAGWLERTINRGAGKSNEFRATIPRWYAARLAEQGIRQLLAISNSEAAEADEAAGELENDENGSGLAPWDDWPDDDTPTPISDDDADLREPRDEEGNSQELAGKSPADGSEIASSASRVNTPPIDPATDPATAAEQRESITKPQVQENASGSAAAGAGPAGLDEVVAVVGRLCSSADIHTLRVIEPLALGLPDSRFRRAANKLAERCSSGQVRNPAGLLVQLLKIEWAEHARERALLVEPVKLIVSPIERMKREQPDRYLRAMSCPRAGVPWITDDEVERYLAAYVDEGRHDELRQLVQAERRKPKEEAA